MFIGHFTVIKHGTHIRDITYILFIDISCKSTVVPEHPTHIRDITYIPFRDISVNCMLFNAKTRIIHVKPAKMLAIDIDQLNVRMIHVKINLETKIHIATYMINVHKLTISSTHLNLGLIGL